MVAQALRRPGTQPQGGLALRGKLQHRVHGVVRVTGLRDVIDAADVVVVGSVRQQAAVGVDVAAVEERGAVVDRHLLVGT